MTKQYFVKLAALLKSRIQKDPTAAAAVASLAHDIAALCEHENPRFDRKRFLKACGL